MNKSLTREVAPALALALSLAVSVDALAHQTTQASGHWATSWYASPQPVWGKDFVLPVDVPSFIENQTLRETVRLSAGGSRLRLVFSNRYGSEPITIGGVRLARLKPPTAAMTERTVTFAGQPGATVAPGAQVISDVVDLPVAPLTQLAVRSYFPKRTPITSFHWGGQQTIDVGSGDWTRQAGFTIDGSVKGRLFLSGVLVESSGVARTVVTLGDSITDGNGSTPDHDRRWPDFLARRLAPHGVAVANAGISGARLLQDRMGVNALARMEQDVLSQPGVTDLIVLIGINDIGWPGSPFAPAERPVTLSELVFAYSQLIASAHARGLRIVGGTLPPFEGALEGTPYAGHYSVAKEQLRQQVNSWIRDTADFDAVVDFDALLRDPDNPRRLLATYDSGNHLHPGDAGYQAMADAVDIAMLIRPDVSATRPTPCTSGERP
ncbi:SGNH/GDSL hydrolase family protein [Noviherbaspirillum sp. Root189]|uniref:SGNH/GDSL hydrolase family protein n=1 Tax=Noviherbaspirillum sp. Root189 TaxID=1736487 RepID=UPI0007098DA1|nr:SGNH/GDSL hydrolase family protein [Noviherbaspirillum sp. Root189]KRB83855.1 lipase [Noviherbaspirillum sp. Root189]